MKNNRAILVLEVLSLCLFAVLTGAFLFQLSSILEGDAELAELLFASDLSLKTAALEQPSIGFLLHTHTWAVVFYTATVLLEFYRKKEYLEQIKKNKANIPTLITEVVFWVFPVLVLDLHWVLCFWLCSYISISDFLLSYHRCMLVGAVWYPIGIVISLFRPWPIYLAREQRECEEGT